MNKLNLELLSAIDNIEMCITESEVDVSSSLCNHYSKIATIMEYSTNPNIDESFTIFQEAADETNKETENITPKSSDNKKEFILVRLVKSIGALIKKIANAIVVQFRGIGRIVQNIFTHPEFRKGFKQNKKDGDKYKDLSMNGVPEFEEAVPEIETVSEKTAEESNNNDTEEKKIVQLSSIVEIFKWYENIRENSKNIIDGISENSKKDVNDVIKTVKKAKTLFNNKVLNKHDTFNGSYTEIMKKLNSKINSKIDSIKDHTKFELFEAMAHLSTEFAKFLADNDFVSSGVRKDISRDATNFKLITDYFTSLETSITTLQAKMIEMLNQIKDIAKSAETELNAAA